MPEPTREQLMEWANYAEFAADDLMTPADCIANWRALTAYLRSQAESGPTVPLAVAEKLAEAVQLAKKCSEMKSASESIYSNRVGKVLDTALAEFNRWKEAQNDRTD